MYANELPEFAKVNLDGVWEFVVPGSPENIAVRIHIMAKPKPGQLAEIFNDLAESIDLPQTITAAIYSDDMVMAGNLRSAKGKVRKFLFNVDISSNDSSQDVPAFLAAYTILAHFNDDRARGLIEQCMLPINAGGHTLKFDGPFEGSGTVLTTILNHLGSLMIVLSSAHSLAAALGGNDLSPEDCIRKGAALVGHSVTIDDCGGDMHRVQFLKRSPYWDGFQWKPYTNLGCILRGLGSVENDLEARQIGVSPAEFQAMSHQERCDRFISCIVAGLVWEPSNPIIAALRARFPGGVNQPLDDWTPPIDGRVDDNTDAILARYELTSSELDQLVSQIQHLAVGDVLPSAAIAKIFSVDYGVLRVVE